MLRLLNRIYQYTGTTNTQIFHYSTGRYVYNQTRSQNFTVQYELTNNNTNNISLITNIYMPWFVAMFTTVGGSDKLENTVKETITISNKQQKNLAMGTITKTATCIHQNKMTITVNYSFNFRPVFKFVDNNKSTNIHY